MKRARTLVQLVFEGGLDPNAAEDARLRGYRSHVWAQLDDGTMHPLTFYDVVRLQQTLTDECASGREFFTEPGLVVVREVSLAIMEDAARRLAQEGFFDPR